VTRQYLNGKADDNIIKVFPMKFNRKIIYNIILLKDLFYFNGETYTLNLL